MSTADWFPVDPGRYLKNTMHLTTRQHGGYWLLILAALENNGELPSSDMALASIAKLDGKAWKEDGDTLKAFLTRRGDAWVHEYAAFVCEQVRSRIDAKANAGRIGAAKRWQGRRKSKPIADASSSQRQTDAHLQVKEDVTASPSVAQSARAMPPIPGFLQRAQPIAADWTPSEQAQHDLGRSRPDLTPERIVERTGEFRRWCAENNKLTHNPDATWLNFMVKTHEHRPRKADTDDRSTAASRGIAAAFARRSIPTD